MQHHPFKPWLLLMAATLACATVQAQDYPTHPVKIIVPFGAGGGTDTMARVVAVGLQKALEQPFVVENKAGASGNIGMEAVAKSPADGYTLLMVTNNIAINPLVYEKIGYDAARDFTPVAAIGSSPVTISVHPSLKVDNLAGLIAYARANPGKVSYASCGSATPQHLAAELLAQMAKIEMVHVPYKGCAAPMTDHLSGRVPVSFSTIANIGPHTRAGKILALAVTSAARSAHAPDLPTVSEAAKLPGYAIDVWFGLFAPAGTPKAVITKLNELVNQQLASPAVKAKMAEQNYDALGGTPQTLADMVSRDTVRYEKVVRAANIKAD